MLRPQNHTFAGLAVATLLAAGTVGTAIAREELRPRFDKVAAGAKAGRAASTVHRRR
jgi:hypothetical protein